MLSRAQSFCLIEARSLAKRKRLGVYRKSGLPRSEHPSQPQAAHCGVWSDAMTTRPRRIQLAALLLAIATMNSGVFPRINSGFEPASQQSRGLREQTKTALLGSAINSSPPS